MASAYPESGAFKGLRGVDEARRDGVHANAVSGKLERTRARQHLEARLGGAVVGSAESGALGAPRRDIDDSPRLPLLHPMPREGLRDQERSLQIGVQHRIPGGFVHVEYPVGGIQPGIVDEDVETAERIHGRLHAGGDRPSVRRRRRPPPRFARCRISLPGPLGRARTGADRTSRRGRPRPGTAGRWQGPARSPRRSRGPAFH